MTGSIPLAPPWIRQNSRHMAQNQRPHPHVATQMATEIETTPGSGLLPYNHAAPLVNARIRACSWPRLALAPMHEDQLVMDR